VALACQCFSFSFFDAGRLDHASLLNACDVVLLLSHSGRAVVQVGMVVQTARAPINKGTGKPVLLLWIPCGLSRHRMSVELG